MNKENLDKNASTMISNGLAECAIAFPVEKRWRSAQEQLGEHIKTINGWEKTKQLMDTVEGLVSNINKPKDEEARLSSLNVVCNSAAGFVTGEAELRKLRETCMMMMMMMMMMMKMKEAVANVSTDSHVIMDSKEALYKFNAQVVSGELLAHCRTVLQLKERKLAWEVLRNGSPDHANDGRSHASG